MKRIHELAKEQGVDATAIIEVLKRAGLPASKCTPASTISEEWEKRLAPIFERLRESERRRLEKEKQAAAVATKTHHGKKTSATATAAPTAPAKGHGHAKAAATGTAGAQASTTGAAKAHPKKATTVQPKRWTEEKVEAAPPVTSELDAWVEAGAPKERKKPSKKDREREKAKKVEVEIGIEDVIASTPPPAAPPRPLTPEEIVRAAGLLPPTDAPVIFQGIVERAAPPPPVPEAPPAKPEKAEKHEKPERPEKKADRKATAAAGREGTAAEEAVSAPAAGGKKAAAGAALEAAAAAAAEAAVAAAAAAAPPAAPAAPAPAVPAPAVPAPAVEPAAEPAARAPAAEAKAAAAATAPGAPAAPAGALAAAPAKGAAATPAAPAPAAPAKAPEPPAAHDLHLAELAEIARRDREAARAAREAKERAEKERKEKEAAAAAARAALAQKKKAAAERKRDEKEEEISPAAAALAAALEAKRRQEAGLPPLEAVAAFEGVDAEEEAVPVGEALLGYIPEEDEEIRAEVGPVPEGPTKKGPIPITRKDKRPIAPAVGGGKAGGPAPKSGFQQGRGFQVNGAAGYAGLGAPARGRGGPAPAAIPGRPGAPAPGGRQFFKMQGGGGTGTRGRGAPQQKFERPEKVTLSPPFTVKELSTAMGVRVPDIIGKLMKKGKMIRMNDPISEELAMEIGLDFDVEVEVVKKAEAEDELAKIVEEKKDRPEDLVPRAPIITVLGHVDHGKTSLLDRIRRTNVAAGEAGGITQHISAWRVEHNGKPIVFVDTPGHEAFTQMRARGANITDVAVLVVAADDGVMPQTEEAYNHAKAAGVPIVVALNKIDKPNANPMRVKQQLATLGLQPVEWGGQTEVIEVSAVTGQGVDTLLETLALQSDIMELKANPKKQASGTCLEARITEGRGIVAQLIVQDGTLRRGDVIVCGAGYGKVRALFDDKGRQLPEAGPATPVEVIGLEEVPEAGAKFYVLDDLAKAKEIAQQRLQRKRMEEIATRATSHVTLENIFERMKAGQAKEIRIVLKADVKGSVEVLTKEIPALSIGEVKVKVLHAGVGGITESDVLLADASDAIVIGFNVVADEKAKAAAEQKGVDVRTYRVIYQITDDLKKAMEGLLEPEEKETVTAQVEVRKTFRASQIGTIAGCYVTKGKLERTNRIRLIRDGVIKHDGEIASLKRLKDDVKEVREGFECGLVIKGYNDIQEGDRIEAYTVEKIARTLG